MLMAEKGGGISTIGIAAVFAGGVLLWSGIKGYSVSATFRALIAGKSPAVEPSANPVTASGLFGPLASLLSPVGSLTGTTTAADVTPVGGGVSGSAAQNKALGQRMAAAAGWTGAEWTAFNNLVMGESGWNANAANPTSNARGIAQNIQGWGPNYQPGNAAQQIGWMINYIKQRYGTPSNAWAQWQARSPHWY
jgi:hypothetical protein